jgi:hypothetical protein
MTTISKSVPRQNTMPPSLSSIYPPAQNTTGNHDHPFNRLLENERHTPSSTNAFFNQASIQPRASRMRTLALLEMALQIIDQDFDGYSDDEEE